MRALSVHFFLFLCLFYQPATHAFPTQDRIHSIEILVESLNSSSYLKDIKFRNDLNFQGPAYSTKENQTYYIGFNPKITNNIPQSALKLIEFHEVGHIYLGHCDKRTKDADDRAEREYEADYFAAFLYRRFEKVTSDLIQFLDFTSTQINTNPPGHVRADIFKKTLGIN